MQVTHLRGADLNLHFSKNPLVVLLALVFVIGSLWVQGSQATPVMYSAREMREIERLRARGVGEVSFFGTFSFLWISLLFF